MTVIDRWHFTDTETAIEKGVPPCACSRGRHKDYPTTDHGAGKQWKVHHRINRKEVTKRFAKFKAAEKYDNKINAMVDEGNQPADPAKGKELLRTHAESYLRDVAGHSARQHGTGYLNNHLMRYFEEHTRLMDVTEFTAKRFLKHLTVKVNPRAGRPYAPATQLAIYTFFTSVMNAAVGEKITVSPTKGKVTFPTLPDRPGRDVWEVDTVEKMLGVLPGWHSTLARVGAACGLRQGEVFAVSVQDIKAGRLLVRHQVSREHGHRMLKPPKRGGVREVPLAPGVAQALHDHMQAHPTLAVKCVCCPEGTTWHLLFHDQGRPLVGSIWNRDVWWPALAAAGVDRLGPAPSGFHEFRHFAASQWLYGGASMGEVAAWFGHKNETVVNRTYKHLISKAMTRGAQIMQDAIGYQTPTRIEKVA